MRLMEGQTLSSLTLEVDSFTGKQLLGAWVILESGLPEEGTATSIPYPAWSCHVPRLTQQVESLKSRSAQLDRCLPLTTVP